MNEKEVIKPLNGIRAIAALLVVFAHYSNDVKMFQDLQPYSHVHNTHICYHHLALGAIGVMLFFSLSGFLMSYIVKDLEFNFKNIYNFFVNRLSRIIPLFIFAIIFTYFYQLIFRGWLDVSPKLLAFNTFIEPRNALLNLFLVKGNSVYWTIGVEVYFYMFFPLFWYITNKKGPIALFILSLCLYAISWRTDFWFTREFNPSRLNHCLQFFLLGSLIHKGIFELQLPQCFKNKNFKHLVNFLGVTTIISLYPTAVHYFFPTLTTEWGYWAFWSKHFWVLISIYILFFLILKLGFLKKFLSHPILQFLGAISFSIYLSHKFILKLGIVFELQDNSFLEQVLFLVCILLPIIILISYGTYKCIELPALKYLRTKFRIKA